MNFIIPGNPIPKPRPRVTRFGNTYNPREKELKAASKILQSQYKEDSLIDGPIFVSVTFFMSIPTSLSKKKKMLLMGKPHCKKPDIDNLLKFTMDCLNSIIKDDALIYAADMKKIYSDNPRTEITIL